MARDENPPFPPGQTYSGSYGGSGVTFSSDDIAATQNLEGKEYVFEDIDYSATSGAKPLRSGRKVRRRVVRNSSAGVLLPKRLVTFEADTSADDYGKRVDGYADGVAERAYPVDEFLPTAGVLVDDLFYIVVEGPAMCKTGLAADATNVISVGDNLASLTAATSGATTAGRIGPCDFTGATAVLANAIVNRVGRALTARTTGNTANDVLVDVGKW